MGSEAAFHGACQSRRKDGRTAIHAALQLAARRPDRAGTLRKRALRESGGRSIRLEAPKVAETTEATIARFSDSGASSKASASDPKESTSAPAASITSVRRMPCK